MCTADTLFCELPEETKKALNHLGIYCFDDIGTILHFNGVEGLRILAAMLREMGLENADIRVISQKREQAQNAKGNPIEDIAPHVPVYLLSQ